MAIFPTVFSYTIQQYSIKELGVNRTALFMNLTPVFTIVLAILFLNEKIYLSNIFSIIIIIASVIMFNRANRREIRLKSFK
jgi:drug/metabolite transporter (DMT)-like permease